VLELLMIAGKSPKRATFARRLEFIRARSLVSLNGELVDQGIKMLEKLNSTPDPDEQDLDPREVTYRLAVSLLRRGKSGDGNQAKPLFEQLLPGESDPLRAQMMRGFIGMSKGLKHEIEKRKREAMEAG
jgi:hypothetical protein